MGKYPVDITDEENAKMKYPFKPTKEYAKIVKNGNVTFLFNHSVGEMDVQRVIEINLRANNT